MPADIFDYFLCITLLILSTLVLTIKDLLGNIIIFIIFGLIVSLTWVQLKAPDIALVEAIIGSALTGALFLVSLGQIESHQKREETQSEQESKVYIWIFAFLSLALAGIVLQSLGQLSSIAIGLGDLVKQVLPQSGVKNPVTAIILNVRGYDTLLEIGVLFLAGVAVLAFNATKPLSAHCLRKQTGYVFQTFLQLLTPIMVILAFYLLWVGAYAPGGAFQAGAMLAGVGLLLMIAGVRFHLSYQNLTLRILLAIGFIVFLLCGLLVINDERLFLDYPEQWAKHLIFMIELFSMISIAVILMVLFAGCSGFLESEQPKGERK